MRRLGPYELLEALGRGAAATVYRAREESTGRSVALKVVARPEDPIARERFLREGAVLAALRHPGILEVHAAGSADGRLYLATALVEGARTLDRAWQGEPLEQRVSWVRDAARALGHA
ncbi:MAG: serine/threonine protein kinase, partial [Planctomycetota bacterium]